MALFHRRCQWWSLQRRRVFSLKPWVESPRCPLMLKESVNVLSKLATILQVQQISHIQHRNKRVRLCMWLYNTFITGQVYFRSVRAPTSIMCINLCSPSIKRFGFAKFQRLHEWRRRLRTRFGAACDGFDSQRGDLFFIVFFFILFLLSFFDLRFIGLGGQGQAVRLFFGLGWVYFIYFITEENPRIVLVTRCSDGSEIALTFLTFCEEM